MKDPGQWSIDVWGNRWQQQRLRRHMGVIAMGVIALGRDRVDHHCASDASKVCPLITPVLNVRLVIGYRQFLRRSACQPHEAGPTRRHCHFGQDVVCVCL